MPDKTVGDMSLNELVTLVDQIVDQRLRELGVIDTAEDKSDTRTLDEVFASIDANLIIRPPGAPTVAQMIREDRDR